MKKITCLITITLFALQLTGCKNQGQSVVPTEGSVNFIAGDVKIISGEKTITANVGDKIAQGMTVKTGTKSIAEIHFQGNFIRINENSSIVIMELTRNMEKNKESTELYVNNGEVFSKISRKLASGEKFLVKTPTAVAGVRGTEFLVNVDGKKSTIKCMEGKVSVKESSSDDSAYVDLPAGNEAIVEKGKPVFIKKMNEESKDGKKQQPDQKEKSKAAIKGKDTASIKGATKIQAEAVKGDIEVNNK